MLQDKYKGLALAVLSSVATGSSVVITKKGLDNAASRTANGTRAATDSMAYLESSMWWVGMATLVVGELANFAAYTFAPPILVTPLGALGVIIGAVLASLVLKEHLGHLGRVGCTLCLLGSLIIILHAPEDRPVKTVDEILHLAIQPAFLLYCILVLALSLVLIFAIVPTHGRSNPLVYITICSLSGSVSVMAVKGLGIALKLTFSGNNQLTHPTTYVFGLVVLVSVFVQMHYLNKALDTFSTNVVNPIYYVEFSTATITASLILFQGWYNTDTATTIALFSGFGITLLGISVLSTSYASRVERSRYATLADELPMTPRQHMRA